MRKTFALLSSFVISAASLSAFSGSAESETETETKKEYSSKVYFAAQESEGFEILHSGRVYFNKSAAPEGESTLRVNTYLHDENNIVGGCILKWKADPTVRLVQVISPKDVYGYLPYIPNIPNPDTYKLFLHTDTEDNTQTATYPQVQLDPNDLTKDYFFALTGEASDSYPMAVFDTAISNSAASGTYSIDFMTEQWGNRTDIIYKPDANTTYEYLPEKDNAPSQFINISSNILGDVDGSSAIDGSDATLALRLYAYASSTADLDISTDGTIAADVDGNGAVDGSDATLILKYYANAPTMSDISLNEFIKENLK